MARFSRMRRSAALLLLTAGFGGLAAGTTSAREIGDVIPRSASTQLAVDSVKRGMIEARHRGFHALVQAASTQQFGHQPTMVNGKTLAQVIVKRQAAAEKLDLHRLFGGNQLSAAEVTSAAASRCSCDSANEAHLELLSRKFRAMENIEAAALAHCREFAVNAHLVGSIVSDPTEVSEPAQSTSVQLPTFAFTTVTTTVTVPDGGTVLIGARKFTQPASSHGMVAARDAAENASQLLSCIAEELTLDQAIQRKIHRAVECEVGIPVAGFPRCFKSVGRSELLSETHAEIAGIQASRQLVKAASPTPQVLHHVGADGLERIGIDFEVTPRIIITEEEEESLLGVVTDDVPPVPPAPRTLAAALMANAAKRRHRFDCVQISPADYIEVTAYRAVTGSHEALLEMPFAMEKLLTLSVEVAPLQEPSGCCLGEIKPTLRMSSLTQERMMRHLANMAAENDDCPGFKCAEIPAPISETEYHFPEVTSWKQLQAKPTDAAPAENPEETGIEPLLEEFVQQLPPRGDAPLANPDYVTAAPRFVSPTMSPLEYAETFLRQDERKTIYRDSQIQPTAHGEPVMTSDNPLLQALGAPVNVTPCESETCRGFTIQFAPCEKPAAVAEAQAFDGPAQILLQDGPGKLEHGYSLTAQPAPEESLDELAQRLERDFLRRAVSGQIQVPEACPSHGAPACGTPVSKSECAAAGCPPVACPPGSCGTATGPGCPIGSPCEAGIAPRQYGGPHVPLPLFGNNIVCNGGVCGNVVLDSGCLPAPATCVAATAPCLAAARCCGATNPTSTAGCQCAECPKGCGGECCCAKKDAAAVPAVTWNPYVTEPAAVPSCTVPAPQMAMVPQTASVPSRWVAPSQAPPVTAIRPELNPAALETHREISRTLGQLAERCEAQGLYQQADALRAQATDFRTSARMIHGNLIEQGCMPGQMPAAQPVAWYPAPPMMPYPMPAPATYAPEPMPTFGPSASPVAPAMYPQPLPIAQPMMVPRY